MNKIEIINNIFPLLETIEEGLLHLKKQISELRWEESLALLEDLFLAVSAIEESIEIMDNQFDINIEFMNNVRKSVDVLLDAYKSGNFKKYSLCIETELIPVFITWKNEVEKALKIYKI